MSYNSKYTGQEVENAIDKVAELNVGIVDANDSIDDPELEYITKTELDNAIAQAITKTLNTSV